MKKAFKKLPDEKQKKILDSAAKIIAKNGYYQANIADICKEAGISNGALYKYFKNKEDFFIAVFLSHFDRISKQFDIFYEVMDKRGLSFFGLIEVMLLFMPSFIKQEKDYITIYQDLGSSYMNSFNPTLLNEIEAIFYRFWVKALEKGKQAGDVKKDIDINLAAYMVDNHFLIFYFSCVSKHYDQRMKAFFPNHEQDLSIEDKGKIFLNSLKEILA